MKKVVLFLFRVYKTFISSNFLWRIFFGDVCRFSPTCSDYAYQAVYRYGTIKGLFLGFKRIIRCHPFSKGGYDPVK